MSEINYWCYRIDVNNIEYFWEELSQGRLRQGWGWDPRQDLRNLQMDEGAKRNLSMHENVKKGDILLVPRLPQWDYVAIVKATADWSEAYQFNIDEDKEDFGHIFPAEYLSGFVRNNANVSGNIRSTLRNPSRFWSISHYKEDVEAILRVPEEKLAGEQDNYSRLHATVEATFKEFFDGRKFSEKLNERLDKAFSHEAWEYALAAGFQELFPYYQVERVGGTREVQHGTDILIRMPSPIPDYQYGIAIQVKDYEGVISDPKLVKDQIMMADQYWNKENIKIIDKWIIVTRALRDQNAEFAQACEVDGDVRVIFLHELQAILANVGAAVLGLRQELV